MAEQPEGYLVSQRLLDQIKSTNQTVSRLPNKTNDRYIGDDEQNRFIVKITAKYTGSDWTVPDSGGYEGTQQISDSAGVFQDGDYVWGDEADSASFSPIIDLRSLETINGNSTDTILQRIPPNSYVEVFQRGGDDGDTL